MGKVLVLLMLNVSFDAPNSSAVVVDNMAQCKQLIKDVAKALSSDVVAYHSRCVPF